MTLTDAGILFALVDKKQDAHKRCRSILTQISKPLLTLWPCFTEAMYFAFKTGGWERQRLFWELVNNGLLRIYFTNEEESLRMQELMLQLKTFQWTSPMRRLFQQRKRLDIAVFSLWTATSMSISGTARSRSR